MGEDSDAWIRRVEEAIVRRQQPLREAELALAVHPVDPFLLCLAAMAAVVEERPDQCLKFQKRKEKRYLPTPGDEVVRAVAQAQQGKWSLARQTLRATGLRDARAMVKLLPGGTLLYSWLQGWVRRIHGQDLSAPPAGRDASIRKLHADLQAVVDQLTAPRRAKRSTAASRERATPPVGTSPEPSLDLVLPGLPLESAALDVRFQPLSVSAALVDIPPPQVVSCPWFRLREALAHLELQQGFDELLCLPHLRGVHIYWYQLEAVRRVLRHFRGRVLLADEVGLGKTVEAGMVLKEYLLRGMAQKVLVLTPASLVGQWRDELAEKFGIDCATSHDTLLRHDPAAFWDQPQVIASIAVARRQEHFERLTARSYDLVIVDEAHHLKDRATRNWQLVDALKKRFLLLLSATPVQNSLVELYNLLTLLKPGIFKTEREFRATYMMPRKPRLPANREKLRMLMRDVMIRNTRALVDVRLPPRRALTLRVEGEEEERACYAELDHLVRQFHQTVGAAHHRLALHHLLTAAGSSPQAAAAALERFISRDLSLPEAWRVLLQRYRAVTQGGKERALLELLAQNPDEKKMIFVHHRETLARLARVLEERGSLLARFDGSMSGPDKDAAVVRFRDHATVLLCTESGGEGRNLQFCNTLINFDLPWNPMAIEQRIGRIHRIGQTREVFLFNLASRGSVEDRLLRVLDEKLNLFQMVVGEVDAILGGMDEERDFAELVFASWVRASDAEREQAFTELEERVTAARRGYEAVKELDEALFGDEFEST